MTDLFIYNADWLVTIDPDRRVISDGAVAVEGDRIVALGKTADLESQFGKARKRISARGRLVMPGMVEGHMHHTQQLIRGLGDGLNMRRHLCDLLWPFEAVINEEEAYVSSLLCQLEMIRSGTTCFIEVANQFPEQLIQAAKESGMRGIFARSIFDRQNADVGQSVAQRLIQSTEESLQSAEEWITRWKGAADGRLRPTLGLRRSSHCSDELFRGMHGLSERYQVPIQVHVAHNQEDYSTSLQVHGMGEVERIDRLGLLSPRWIMIHMAYLTPEELMLAQKNDVKIIHCPATAFHVGFGVTQSGRFLEMLELGMTVSLGSDAAPSGGFVDMLKNMLLTIGLHRDSHADARVMAVETAIEMATIHGARAAFWDDEIGSLEIGKKADLIIFDMSGPEWHPQFQPLFNVVYSSQKHDIETVIIDGRVVMENREFPGIDLAGLVKRGEALAWGIAKRSNQLGLIKRAPGWHWD